MPGAVPATPAAETRDQALARSPRVADRHAQDHRLDRADRRAHRRRLAQGATARPSTPTAPTSCCSRRWAGRTPITPISAGSAPAPAPLPNATTVWTADAQALTPGKPLTLTCDNGQGLVFRRTIAVDDNVHVHRPRRRSRTRAARRHALPLRPGRRATASRTTLGYYVLHEGLIGVLGEQGLQEFTYDDVDKEPLLSARHQRQGLERTSPAASSASPTSTGRRPSSRTRRSPIRARFTSVQDRRRAGSTRPILLGDAARSRPAPRIERDAAALRRRQGSRARSTATRRTSASSSFDLLIDWGWFYFITKPIFNVLDFFYQPVRQFRRRDPDRHRAAEDPVLPARQQVLRLDGEDEGGAARDGGDPRALRRRQDEAAAGADGALQEGEDQSGRRLLAGADPDPGLLRALQGAVRHHRDAARAVLRLDPATSRRRTRPRSSTCSACCPSRVPAIPACSASGRSSWASRCSSR